MSAYEVVIVGGGPAGLSTALFLVHHRKGLVDRVVVLEKARYPRDKYCAGALGGRADRALAAIGVRVDVPSVVAHGVSAEFQRGDVTLRDRCIGRVVRRFEFDHALAQAARARGIRVVEGARVTAVQRTSDGVRVDSDAGAFEGRAVVGADGVGSVVRRAMGLSFGRLRAQVVEVDTEPVPSDRPRDLLHFDMRDRSYAGYAWDFPTLVGGRELVCRGVYVLQDGVPLAEGAAPDAAQILARHLASRGLDLAQHPQKRFAERGLDARAPIARPRLLLAGEAAGIDPMLGEGIAQAIDYGALAGQYLGRKLDEGDLRFDDWGDVVARSTLGRDIDVRTRVMRRFYGPPRERVERSVQADASFLRVGVNYFAGKPLGASNVLRAVVGGAVLLGRIGLDRVGASGLG